MNRYAILMAIAAALAGSAGTAAHAQITSAQQSALRANCRSDFMSHCSGVTPGGKDALVCLQKNVDKLSGGCQTAVRATMPAPAPAAAAKPEPAPQAVTAAPPPAIAPSPAPQPPAPAAAAASPSPAPAAVAAPHPVAPKAKVAAPHPVARPAPAATAVAAPPAAAAIDAAKLKSLKFTCRGDVRRLCKNVPEGPEALACLKAHSARLSANCRTSVADVAASIPDGAAMPPPTSVAVKPAPAPHRPKAPVIDAAVMVRACKLDMVRHCHGIGVGGGKMLACLTAHEADLTFRCRAAMKVSSPLH